MVNLKKLTLALAVAGAAWGAVALGQRQAGGSVAEAPEYRRRGNPRAAVVVAEYSDFQCPRCAQVEPFVKDFLARHGDRVAFEFHHYPLPMHTRAFLAARAAEAAGRQGKFWEFHGWLFENQHRWAEESKNPLSLFFDQAKALRLDVDRFRRDLDDPLLAKAIEAARDSAKARDINATPTFFINRRRLVGSQFEAMADRFLELELAGDHGE
jgi:protein-disulfide isomerase